MTSEDRTTLVTILCNNTNPCVPEVDGAPEVWRTLMAVYLGAILLLSVGFNSTICLVFYKKPHLLSISNCFVLNLACCQLFMCLLVMPFSLVAVVSHRLAYTGPWCQIQGFLSTVVIVTLQLTLLTISLDRNYAIMNSLRYNSIFTQRLCTILTSGSWIFGVIMAIPPLLKVGLADFTFQRYQFICTLNWTSSSGYLLAFGVIVFCVPILIESGCYIRIFMAAVSHTKRSTRVYPSISVTRTSKFIAEGPNDSPEISDGTTSDTRNHAAGCKAVRTIFLIALFYSMCWVPYFINAFLKSIYTYTNPHLSAASICMLYSAGILNPIIYVYLNRVIRREIGKFVCGSESQTDADDVVSTSMSTFSSAKQTAMSSHQRLRSRSTGGPANEMDTIVEESEDNCVFETISVNNLKAAGVATSHNRRVVIIDDKARNTIAGVSKTTNELAKHNGENVGKSFSDAIDELNVKERNDTLNASIDSKKERVNLTNLKEKSTNKSIINTALEEKKDSKIKHKSKDPQHTANTSKRLARSNSFTYFSKSSRRKRRDCGSFLYFDRERPLLEKINEPTPKSQSDRKRKWKDFSLDHRISMSAMPRVLNFRLSMTDIRDPTSHVTIRSKVNLNENERSNRDSRPSITSESESSGVLDGETLSTESAPSMVNIT